MTDFKVTNTLLHSPCCSVQESVGPSKEKFLMTDLFHKINLPAKCWVKLMITKLKTTWLIITNMVKGPFKRKMNAKSILVEKLRPNTSYCLACQNLSFFFLFFFQFFFIFFFISFIFFSYTFTFTLSFYFFSSFLFFIFLTST